MSCCFKEVAKARIAAPDPAKHMNYTQGMVLGVEDFTQEFVGLHGRTMQKGGGHFNYESMPDGPHEAVGRACERKPVGPHREGPCGSAASRRWPMRSGEQSRARFAPAATGPNESPLLFFLTAAES